MGITMCEKKYTYVQHDGDGEAGKEEDDAWGDKDGKLEFLVIVDGS